MIKTKIGSDCHWGIQISSIELLTKQNNLQLTPFSRIGLVDLRTKYPYDAMHKDDLIGNFYHD